MKIMHHTVDCKTGKVTQVEAEHPHVLTHKEAAERDAAWRAMESARAKQEADDLRAMQEALGTAGTHPGIAAMLRRAVAASPAPVAPRDPGEAIDAGWRWDRAAKQWKAPQ